MIGEIHFCMKTNYIYTGDCVTILKNKIDKNSVDLIFADPPYNLSGNGLHWINNKTGGDWYMVNEEWDKMTAPEYLKFTRKWIGGCFKTLKDNLFLWSVQTRRRQRCK